MDNHKLILPAILVLFFILFQSPSFADVPSPRAVSGVMDLSQTPLNDEVERLPLTGDWEFYWMQLLEPKDFNSLQAPPPDFIEVPSSWKGKKIGEEPLGYTGYATYRLQLTIHPADIGQEKVIALENIGSAYQVWIDGAKRGGAGVVGTMAFEEEPSLEINHYHFIPTHEVIEIVIQVSNFSYRKAGLYTQVAYQNSLDTLQSTLRSEMDSFLIIGGLLFVGLYNLIISTVTGRVQRDLLMIGLASLCMATRSLLINDYLATIILSEIPWSVIKRMEYMVEIISFLFVILSMRLLYPRDIHPVMMRLTYVYVILCVIYNVFASTLLFTQTMVYQFLIMVLITSYFIFYVGVSAFLRKREGAVITLVGLLILVIGILNDVLSSALIIPSVFELEYSFLLFIMLQGVIVSYRYLALFKRNHSLNKQLQEMNEQLEMAVEQRTQQLMEKNKELGQANLKLEALSSTDGLTGLANRRHLNKVLEAEWIKGSNKGQPMAVILMDIDFYKHFNDTYGHLGGDDGLKLIAGVLRDYARAENAFAARYGGEEFMVILSEATLDHAYHTAEKLRQAIENLQEPHRTSPYGVLTVSVGVAIGGPQTFESPEKLIEHADQALYQAKAAGRNKVIAA
ncbi:diguanylate cyclase [Ammoniphilus sp. YIM 78166]|uniref:diguanylate cyclase n=1 Tax=Ammoniphilus sp. YIM 78166 TaxID=1644106 RepID=UPI00106F6E03|nr:diguanylate cyclase [Ammoniphilus sp. YIM 78166]